MRIAVYSFLLLFVSNLLVPQVSASSVIDTIVVGDAPAGMSITPDGSKLYVVNGNSYSVSVINTKTNSIIKTIPLTVNSKPQYSAISPDGAELYVTERMTSDVKIISTASDVVLGTVHVPSGPIFGITVTPDGSKIYVTSTNVTGTIRMSIIDVASRTVVDYIDTLDPHEQIVFNPDGKVGYVPLQKQSNTSILFTNVFNLDTKAVIGTIADTWVTRIFNNGLFGWGFDPFGNTVDFIDFTSNTIIDRIPVTSSPTLEGLKLSSDESYMYSVNRISNTVTVIDNVSKDIVEIIPVTGPLPNTIVVSPNGRYLYVAHPEVDLVDIIQLDSVPDTNNAPVFNLIDDKAVHEDEALQFTVSASDPDGDVVTLSVDGVPDGALFNESTGVFSWTPSLTSSGEYTVTFTATDDATPALSSEIDMHIVVTDVPPVVEPKDVYDLIHELIAAVEGYVFPSATEQSYMANLKKVESFLNSAKYIPAENQIRSFVKKLTQDFKAGKITQVQYDDLLGRANAILEAIPDDAFGMVPRMTQVMSPYPSLAETSAWANAVYADGRADKVGDCGRTIAQCGCAITSLSMIGKSHEIDTGFDGSAVNPLHMNKWLLANGGYSHDGSVLWNYALAYMGQEKNGKVMSKLSLDGYNEKNVDVIKKFIDNGNPSLGFSAAKGHYVTLTGTIDEGGYSINDPLWYNTRTTDDDRDVVLKVQDYNNVISKANLIGYSAALKPLSESVEIVLESPAELLVTDEKGRRLGYIDANTFVSEIPRGTYDREDYIVNPENPTASPHKVKRIFIAKPEGEVFDVRVIGTGEGLYHVSFAVTDGVGGLFGDSSEGTAHVGSIDGYTVTTMRGTEALPIYLQNIIKLIPVAEQKKFVQTFAVIAGQVEKDHVVSTNHIIENLIRYMEEKYRGKSWVPAVVSALRALEQ